MLQINDTSAVCAQWRREADTIHHDRDSELIDWFLAGHRRLVGVAPSTNKLLYLDLREGRYWELRFEDWPDGRGGSASLTPVPVQYAQSHYRRSTSFTVEEHSGG